MTSLIVQRNFMSQDSRLRFGTGNRQRATGNPSSYYYSRFGTGKGQQTTGNLDRQCPIELKPTIFMTIISLFLRIPNIESYQLNELPIARCQLPVSGRNADSARTVEQRKLSTEKVAHCLLPVSERNDYQREVLTKLISNQSHLPVAYCQLNRKSKNSL